MVDHLAGGEPQREPSSPIDLIVDGIRTAYRSVCEFIAQVRVLLQEGQPFAVWLENNSEILEEAVRSLRRLFRELRIRVSLTSHSDRNALEYLGNYAMGGLLGGLTGGGLFGGGGLIARGLGAAVPRLGSLTLGGAAVGAAVGGLVSMFFTKWDLTATVQCGEFLALEMVPR